jgi:hypothetical protein
MRATELLCRIFRRAKSDTRDMIGETSPQRIVM